ncbi:MAG TPA: carboxymuconolactone decarboxylase family protein [Gaiellaceae bacterium]|nr:carboxymuconolactone decarboxylase family protein [Gaiellaceae bacterium]
MTTESERALLDDFDLLFGPDARAMRTLRETDARYVDAYARYARAAMNSGVLPGDVRALLLLALEASLTTLDGSAIETRIDSALDAGATTGHVLHVLMLVSLCSIHSLTAALPALASVIPPPPGPPAAPEPTHWYWASFDEEFPGFHRTLEARAPELFSAYRELGRAIWEHPAGLEPKWQELVFVAMDIATTHLYLDGARLHAMNAVRLGATAEQVFATVALAAAQGAKSIGRGVPALRRVLERRGLG